MPGLCDKAKGRKEPTKLNTQTNYLKWFDYKKAAHSGVCYKEVRTLKTTDR